MAAGTYNMLSTRAIEQGATFVRTFTYYSATSTGPVVDLTGYSARLQVRRFHNSADTLLSLTSTSTRLSISSTAGLITVRLPSTATAALEWRQGVYDLEVHSSGGVVTRLLEGRIEVRPEVTR